jgi:fido (protein-threonine AMPylation protein)
MCADILKVEGFTGIDPQSPLGGPDGGKDILCEKNGMTFVAACHFATGDLSFTKTTKKFDDDLAGALKHKRDAFIFMTNQRLTPTQRTDLEKRAGKKGQRCLIYARENLRIILDSAQGYSVRLNHLGVPMTIEEQAAFFASSGESLATAIVSQTRAIERLSGRVDRLARGSMDFFVQSIPAIAGAVAREEPPEDVARMLKETAEAVLDRAVTGPSDALSAALSTPLLRYVHRLIMFPDTSFAGFWRQTEVFLATSGGKRVEHVRCPSWDKVPELMEELIRDWNAQFSQLVEKSQEEVIQALARFFRELLWIHPFIDGNGRLARSILSLQARELLQLREDLLIGRGPEYYAALRLADGGDFSKLVELIKTAVENTA